MDLDHIKIKKSNDTIFHRERCNAIVITPIGENYYGYYYIKIGEYDNCISIELTTLKETEEEAIKDIKEKIHHLTQAFQTVVLNSFTYKDFMYNFDILNKELKNLKSTQHIKDSKYAFTERILKLSLDNKQRYFDVKHNEECTIINMINRIRVSIKNYFFTSKIKKYMKEIL